MVSVGVSTTYHLLHYTHTNSHTLVVSRYGVTSIARAHAPGEDSIRSRDGQTHGEDVCVLGEDVPVNLMDAANVDGDDQC